METIMNAATQANTETQTTDSKAKSFKNTYEESLKAQNVKAGARDLSEELLNIMFSHRVPAGFSDLNNKIAEAAKRNDVEEILKLSQQLKNVKDNEAANQKAIADLKKKHTFSDVLQAFNDEFEELAYQVAAKTFSTTHALIVQAGSKQTGKKSKDTSDSADTQKRTMAIFKITKDGKSVELPMRPGRAASNLTQDKEAFDFLNFKIVTEEGKEVLEPGTIAMNEKDNVTASRANIVKAIEEKVKGFEDYTVEQIQ